MPKNKVTVPEVKEAKLVKCVVVDNSNNKGWNVGDGVETMSDDPRIKSGELKEVTE